MPSEFAGLNAGFSNFVGTFKDVGVRNLLLASNNLDLRPEFLHQRMELFKQIVPEVFSVRNCRFVDAWSL